MQTQSASNIIRRLTVSADTHKRLAQNHRNLAVLDHELIEDLVAFCREHNIRIEIAEPKEAERGR